jgi:hypothetical protein
LGVLKGSSNPLFARTRQSKPRQLCFFAFLPDILDTGAAGRNAYIQILKDLASK